MSATTRSVTYRSLIAVVLCAVALATLASVAGPSAGAAPAATKRSQPVTIGVDDFPPVLNNLTTAGNGAWTAMIADAFTSSTCRAATERR